MYYTTLTLNGGHEAEVHAVAEGLVVRPHDRPDLVLVARVIEGRVEAARRGAEQRARVLIGRAAAQRDPIEARRQPGHQRFCLVVRLMLMMMMVMLLLGAGAALRGQGRGRGAGRAAVVVLRQA